MPGSDETSPVTDLADYKAGKKYGWACELVQCRACGALAVSVHPAVPDFYPAECPKCHRREMVLKP